MNTSKLLAGTTSDGPHKSIITLRSPDGEVILSASVVMPFAEAVVFGRMLAAAPEVLEACKDLIKSTPFDRARYIQKAADAIKKSN